MRRGYVILINFSLGNAIAPTETIKSAMLQSAHLCFIFNLTEFSSLSEEICNANDNEMVQKPPQFLLVLTVSQIAFDSDESF